MMELLLCGNRSEFAIVLAATQRTGTRITPINWHLTEEEVSYIVDNSDAKVFIAEAKYKASAEFAAKDNTDLFSCLSIGGEISNFSDYQSAIAAFDASNLTNPMRGGAMLYTSGTTGPSKVG